MANGFAHSLRPIPEMDIYLTLAASSNVTSLCRRTHTLLLRAGFSDFCYVLASPIGAILGQAGTQSEKIAQRYLTEFNKYDLVIQHCLISESPVFQEDVLTLINGSPIESEFFNKTKEFSIFLESFGYDDYFSIPFPSGSNEGRAIFYIGSKGEGRDAFRQRVLRYQVSLNELAHTFDQVINRKFPELICGYKVAGGVTISAKPLLLLDVLANHNVSLSEASDILHISISTANQHIAAAKKALGVQTTAAAIVTAIKLRLIEIKNDR